MPSIKNNQGFGYLPILVISALVLTGTYFGYSWYSNNSSQEIENKLSAVVEEDNSDIDVLQAATIGNSKDINTFLLLSLFDSSNINEFNKNNSPIIVSTSEQLDKCIFLPRSSKPLSLKYNFNNKIYGANVYQNISLQILPKNIVSKKYMAVIPKPGAQIAFRNTYTPIRNSCGTNVYLFEQPVTPIDENNFSSMLVLISLTGPSNQIPVSKPEISIFEDEISIKPSKEGTKLEASVYKAFVQKGITVVLAKKPSNSSRVVYRNLVIKNFKCSGDCNNGFTTIGFKKLKDQYGTLNLLPDDYDLRFNDTITKLVFPQYAPGVNYDLPGGCPEVNSGGQNTFTYYSCPIGMLYSH